MLTAFPHWAFCHSECEWGGWICSQAMTTQESRGIRDYSPSHGAGLGRHLLNKTAACREGKPVWCRWMLFESGSCCPAPPTNCLFTSTLADQALIFDSRQYFIDTQFILCGPIYSTSDKTETWLQMQQQRAVLSIHTVLQNAKLSQNRVSGIHRQYTSS